MSSHYEFYRGFHIYLDNEKNVLSQGYGKSFIVYRYRVIVNKPTVDEAVNKLKHAIDLWHQKKWSSE